MISSGAWPGTPGRPGDLVQEARPDDGELPAEKSPTNSSTPTLRGMPGKSPPREGRGLPVAPDRQEGRMTGHDPCHRITVGF